MANPPKGKAKAKPAAAKKPAPRSGKTATSRAKTKPVDSGQKYVVSGVVTYTDSAPAAGLTIIAYDKDVSGKEKLGQTTTDAAGNYIIRYSDADFRKTAKERGGADVVVCVYDDRDGKHEDLYTHKKQNNAPANYELNIKLPAQPFVVRGTVTDANHQPLANLIVRASERDLRIPQLLGTDETTANGEYRIEYLPADFLLGDVPSRRNPWLIVEVLEEADGQSLAKQEVQRAAHDQTVLFTLTNVGVVSEWQRISEAVAPLLKGQGAQAEATRSRAKNGNEKTDLHPADLTGADVDFIVLETGFDRAAVQAWATSSRMLRDALLQLTDEYPAQQAALRENGWPFFFGIARQGQANDLDAVLRESAESLNWALKAAVSAHRIPPLNEKQVEILLGVLKLLQGLQQLDSARSSNSDFSRVLASLSTPLPKVVALDALVIVQEKGLNDVVALLELTKRHPDAEAPIKTFVRGVRVHQLTSGHEEFSRLLNVRLEGGSDSIAPLAAMPSAEWMSMAAKASISPGLALQTQAQAEKQHPLTALQAKVSTGNFELPGVSGGEMAALVKAQPEVAESILRGTKRIKDTVDGQEAPAAHKVLRDMGRFMRTGVSMELGAVLMKGGISSPGAAIRHGREYVREIFQNLPQGAAQEVTDGFFDTAEPIINGAKGYWIGVSIDANPPAWMREMYEDVPLALPDPVRQNLPTLPGLFGDLDECICKPCDSMLGQPAYLVDLLNLLGAALRKLLKDRRPDIFTLPLSCENADLKKTTQHIYIVLEILERVAAGAAPGSDQHLNQQKAYEKLASAIFSWRLPFSLPYVKTKAYLAKLGVSRFDLLSLRSSPPANQLAAETLNLTFAQTPVTQGPISEWELLTEQREGKYLWKAYGFTPDSAGRVSLVDPASNKVLDNKPIEDVLTRVSVLIDRTGLELDELREVFKTEFVSDFQGVLTLSNLDQCKTSEMRLSIESEEGQAPLLEGCLGRLHLFTRLRAKLPGWSIVQVGKAIKACGGIEAVRPRSTPQHRERVLVKLAIIKRLHDEHGMPLDFPHDRMISEANLRKLLGLSAPQFALLKALTALDPTAITQSFNWAALEEFCNAAKRIRESGLSIEQVAQALLWRSELSRLAGELPPTIKTDKQIEKLLKAVQQRLRSVVAIRPDLTLESQAAEALPEIFDATTADKLVKAIRDAGMGTPIATGSALFTELKQILSDTTNATRSLGEWSPLLTDTQAESILSVVAPDNLSADDQFKELLKGIVTRRRERELIAVIVEQCGLVESEVAPLLGSRLLLDLPAQGQSPTFASDAFLNTSFWANVPLSNPAAPRGVTPSDFPLLHAWMDRLYRLITLSAALKIDGGLMQLADPVVVNSTITPQVINWRELLASTPPAPHSAWPNPHWQALLDFAWLQQPEQLSRPALSELLSRLATLARNSIQTPLTVEAIRPIATRLEIPDTQTLDIAALATTVTTDNLRDPSKLRRVFELLLLARHLGANDTQIAQLANLADNAQAATTAEGLLHARLGEQEREEVWRAINDKLRQQRRDALVAYLVHQRNDDKLRNANDLYERHLIDPQMEPCFETTRVLEAITATQLFAQRILFGLEEGVVASQDLKDRWTWMRNYRVWEANRKVFLFPENWLFPELRDDKSSSFKQLESALGQGELNQDLANQSFGQFLDDVVQMGQVQVLGMYEDIARHPDTGQILRDESKFPVRRTLYVIGRTNNPPYAYFWRHCVDFGSPYPYMEWSPWQRIELDIQDDHVLPFVLGGSLYIAWPLIRSFKEEGSDEDSWEIKLAWSQYDGKSWKKTSISREPWSDKAAPFSEKRGGFSLRCETTWNGAVAKLIVYARSTSAGTFHVKNPTLPGVTESLRWGNDFNAALNYVQWALPLVNLMKENFSNLPEDIKDQLTVCWMMTEDWTTAVDPHAPKVQSGGDPLYINMRIGAMEFDSYPMYVFYNPPEAIRRHKTAAVGYQGMPATNPDLSRALPGDAALKAYISEFIDKYIDYSRSITDNTSFNRFIEQLRLASSRRIISCKAWMRVTASGDEGDLVALNGTEGSYSCWINGQNLTPNISPSITISKLGEQLAATYTLNLIVNGVPGPLPSSSETLTDVPEEGQKRQTLNFEIDGRSLTQNQLIAIGIDIQAHRELLHVAEFHLTQDDLVTKTSGSGDTLVSQVANAQPWMNGFQETSAGQLPFTIARRGYLDQVVFDTSKDLKFWSIGSASSYLHDGLPLSWHYSEGEVGCYVDLGDRFANLPNNSFLVYPDSYLEVSRYRYDWSQHQTLPAIQAQVSTFGADKLPVPLVGNATNWDKAKTGALTFDARIPYACYNWEVFFHAPLLIADQLSKQHKFEDAERWLRYVFDPTSTEAGTNAKRFLKFRVFNELNLNQQVIDDLTALAQAAGGFATDADIAAVEKMIDRWRDAPFRPFLIARRRHIAFLWRTLFAYLDNLIAWADSLYRRDTIESINEATMLYVLAERILGRRPKLHEGKSNREALSYEAMNVELDEFANYWIDTVTGSSSRLTQSRLKGEKKQPNPDGMLYFCMPFNDKIMSYWNTVDSRLSNVRNCRNIEGIERKLPLMDAPIDPELLIRATAAGLDLGDVIAGLYAPPPHYRYSILSARAAELTNEAKSLGAAMLSAIEKRDAEHLAQLRSANEINLLRLVSEVRKLQITEAERNIDALRASRKSIGTRYNQYQRLLGNKDANAPDEGKSAGEVSMLGSVGSGMASERSKLGLISEENEQYESLKTANDLSTTASIVKVVSGGLHAASGFSDPAGIAHRAFSGSANAVSAAADALSIISQGWRIHSDKQGMISDHLRRRDEWAFQSNQTLKEMQQIDKQILANQIRIDITGKELNNHIEQIEQAKAVDEVMRSKFSNEQLYEWMKTELSKLYFSAYRMALDMARKAERAAARELGVKPLNILGNAYWDSLRDGLLAGERLHQDLKRLEIAYLDQNRREYEMTKHISLRRLNPQALVKLRAKDSNGRCRCDFNIPEWLFDLDTPGHYLRRIKSVSVSIPSVAGPFTSVSCKLTLLKSQVRHERTAANYPRTPDNDTGFTDYFGASEAIVTSTGNGDSGLFETNLRDERFLPFEGSGVISEWRLELPDAYPQFDYSTISDVVLSIRYTARDGGDLLRNAATSSISTLLTTTPPLPATTPLRFPVVLSCRSDFPTEWSRARAGGGLKIKISSDFLPYWMTAARPQLYVRKVEYFNLIKGSTSSPTWTEVWPTPASGNSYTANQDGYGEADLPTVGSDDVTDRIVLVSVGRRQ